MIELQHVYKVYAGNTPALKDVCLNVSRGEFVFLIGPSGAGKTTLFRLLSAYDKATSGIVDVLGFKLNEITPEKVPFFRRNIGVVYQDFRLIKRNTIYENVALPLQVRGTSQKQIDRRVLDVLDSVGLLHKADEFPDHLSGGEQQRVAIARALVHQPGLLIADEPTGNLDPTLANSIVELFSKINAQGTTVFVATHDHDLVRRSNKRVVELRHGHIVKTTEHSHDVMAK
jgi:cell division transport system ATP-binding protein